MKWHGFTIVELLIVIVVIAILAAISVVSYNGIQTRAENSKTVAAVQAYKKALLQYATVNGSYPTTGGRCLGDTYPVLDGGTSDGCRYSTAILPNSAGALMVTELTPYLGGSFPMPSTKILYNSSGTGYVGSYLYGTNYSRTLDGEPIVELWYTIESDTCPVGPVYSTAGSPNLSSPPVSRTATINSNASRCMIALPDASRL